MSDQATDSQSTWFPSATMPRFRDLHQRRIVDERMDDPDIDPQLLIQALKGIRRINVLSATAASIWPVLRKLASAKPIRVLDLACGGGDVAIALARKARRSNMPITFEGCDISPTAIAVAQESARRQHADIPFFETDLLHDSIPTGYDVIYSSLFVHHLTTSQVTKLIGNMAAAAPAIIVDDLIRSRTGLLLAYAACHSLTRSPVVHHDGPNSVAAAFTIQEFRAVADDVGLADYTLSWKWPYRFQFVHSKKDRT